MGRALRPLGLRGLHSRWASECCKLPSSDPSCLKLAELKTELLEDGVPFEEEDEWRKKGRDCR